MLEWQKTSKSYFIANLRKKDYGERWRDVNHLKSYKDIIDLPDVNAVD